MEPVSGKISWLGPKPIVSTLSDNDVYMITPKPFQMFLMQSEQIYIWVRKSVLERDDLLCPRYY